MEERLELEKRQKLRNNEYYTLQQIFDNLYEQSCKGISFTDLMQHISSENNILLAYRNIKKNKGSTTCGTDNLDISIYKEMNSKMFVKRIQNSLNNYFPKSVRRVEIPKPNGKTRPLGIPCIEDRIIQQCIKQVIEPICEAKFHKHSYGFRPNRSTDHAIARCMSLMNHNKLHYVVDVDIKGFFDNVNHSKLKKQLWSLGIQDKNLISILGKTLKSEIQGIGIPTKGTPQGGIISPLLANVVLNELDWWIDSQWESMKTRHKYASKKKNGKTDNSSRIYALKKTNLKELYIVRYADDFKIFCRDCKTAQKIYVAVKNWLKERLDLEISPEKSKVTNLRKNYTEFLGFKLMVKPKKKKYVCQSKMCDKAVQSTIKKMKEQIKRIQKYGTEKELYRLNSIILGSHNYYNSATQVAEDFGLINYLATKSLDIRLKRYMTSKPIITETYKRLYGDYNGKKRTILGITIFPIHGCRTKPPMCCTQEICNYTKIGRDLIHNNLKNGALLIMRYLAKGNEYMSTELFDNSISLIAGQQGICYIAQNELEIGNMECHHRKPKSLGGKDEYKNLVWLCFEAHKLVHATEQDTLSKYLEILKLDEKGLKRLNTLRKLVGNSVI